MKTRNKNSQYNLRLPEELKTYLQDEAKRNSNSLNAEITERLEVTRDQDIELITTFFDDNLDNVQSKYSLVSGLLDEYYQLFNDLVKNNLKWSESEINKYIEDYTLEKKHKQSKTTHMRMNDLESELKEIKETLAHLKSKDDKPKK